MTFTFTTSGAILQRAGENVDSTIAASDAMILQYNDEAQGYINAVTRYDWVVNSAAIGANFKPILATAISCLAAIDCINYNMSGYTSRGEAEDMINILYDRAQRSIEALKDDKVKTIMGITGA